MMSGLAALALLSICGIVAGALELVSTPQNVRLVSEDFRLSLTWEVDPASESLDYDIEIHDSGRIFKDWTRVNQSCQITDSWWRCDLSSYVTDIIYTYWARVRAVRGISTSNWTRSNELTPYSDVILSPPELAVLVQGHRLQVNITTAFTPHQDEERDFWNKLKWKITFREGPREVDCWKGTFDFKDEGIAYTSNYALKPTTTYCVWVQMSRDEKTAHAEKCIQTAPGEPDFVSIAIILAAIVTALILFCSPVVYSVRQYVHPKPSKMGLPRTLAVFTEGLNTNLSTKTPDYYFKADSLSLLSVDVLLPEGDSEAEGRTPHVPPMPGEYDFQHNDGCRSNGFGPGYCDSEAYLSSAPSRPSTQEGLAGSVSLDLSSSAAGLLEGDCPGRSVPQRPTPASLQVYSEWPSSVSEGSGADTVFAGVTQTEDLLSNGRIERARCSRTGEALDCRLNIPLNSVKLQACMELLHPLTMGDFYDTGTDESADDDNMDLCSVGSFQNGCLEPPHDPVQSEVNVKGSGCGYEPRPIISSDQKGRFSGGYEFRGTPCSMSLANETVVSVYFCRDDSAVV